MTTSLSQALSIALSGLQTSTALITVASNNISNASTPGYTAKTAELTNLQDGSEFSGATVAGYSRATSQALTNNYNTATSVAGYLGAQNGYMAQVQTILNSTSNNPTLSNDVAQFSAAWEQYTSDPESDIQQQSVISAGTQLANDINSVATQIDTLSDQVQSDTQTTVNSLNSDLQQIAQVNVEIQSAAASNQPTVDLQDQRDTLVNQVSSIVQVNVQTRPTGEIALYTQTGQLLVDSGVANQYTYTSGTSTITDSNGTDVTNLLTGGSLQGELQFNDTGSSAVASTTPGIGVLGKLQAQLSKLVDAFTNSSGNTPSPFATAFTAASTASTATNAPQNGDDVATQFFTASNDGSGNPEPSSFAVNTNLINGDEELPQTDTQGIAASFNTTASYTASGLNITNATYTTLTTAILSGFQQAANTINAQNTTASSQQSFYQQTLSNATGVNMDTELADLVNYQNSYAASAHVISTVSQLMTTLLNSV